MDSEEHNSFESEKRAETAHGIQLTSPDAAPGILDAFFSSSLAGMAIMDGQLRFARINNALARINGVPVTEHIGRMVTEVLPELGPSIEPMIRAALQSGRPILKQEVVGTTLSQPGVIRSWICSYIPIRGADGGPIGVVQIVVEISNLRRAESPSVGHSEDYRSVRWYGENYLFSAKQAACVKVLWFAWENKTPYLADGTVLAMAGIGEKQRLRDVFKKHLAWGTMIVQGPLRDIHCLKPPMSEMQNSSTPPTESPT